jgi:hypothetical protein
MTSAQPSKRDREGRRDRRGPRGVNKAIVDLQAARDTAAVAQRDADAASQAVTDANAAIAAAQQRFDSFAATTYINGPAGSYLAATSPEDIIATAAAGQTLSVGFQQAFTDLRRARTEQTNKESAARAAQQQADQAAAEAQRTQDDAVAALSQAQANFGGQQAEVDRLVAKRDTAQARLNAARGVGHSTTQPPPQPTGPAPADQWDRAASTAPSPINASEWDTTLPMVPSANIAGDPVAIVNSVLQISSTSAQVTAELGRKFLAGLGINLGGGAPAAGDVANGRPLLVGRRQRQRAEPRYRPGCKYRRVRLLRADPVRLRRCGDQAAALFRFAVQRGPQDPVVTDAPGRLDLLRAQCQSARSDVSRRRDDARGSLHGFAGQGLTGSFQWDDAVCHSADRVLTLDLLRPARVLVRKISDRQVRRWFR